jgi:hypothetical protein
MNHNIEFTIPWENRGMEVDLPHWENQIKIESTIQVQKRIEPTILKKIYYT